MFLWHIHIPMEYSFIMYPRENKRESSLISHWVVHLTRVGPHSWRGKKLGSEWASMEWLKDQCIELIIRNAHSFSHVLSSVYLNSLFEEKSEKYCFATVLDSKWHKLKAHYVLHYAYEIPQSQVVSSLHYCYSLYQGIVANLIYKGILDHVLWKRPTH